MAVLCDGSNFSKTLFQKLVKKVKSLMKHKLLLANNLLCWKYEFFQICLLNNFLGVCVCTSLKWEAKNTKWRISHLLILWVHLNLTIDFLLLVIYLRGIKYIMRARCWWETAHHYEAQMKWIIINRINCSQQCFISEC